MQDQPPRNRVQRISALEGYDLWADDYDAAANPVVAMDRRLLVVAAAVAE